MDNGGDMLQLCRLCLVKEDVNIPIFEEQGDSGQIYVKISSCLPVKVQRNDNLPQNICDSCFNKLDVVYDLWTTSTNSEKQLHTWLKATETANNELIQQKRLTKATNKTSDAIVKQEAVEDSFVQEVTWDEASSSAGPSVTVVSQEEPPPKRARRAAAVKASITVAAESDDDDETEPMTKMEEDSEDEDDPDATFGEVPSTSADDQPGPSGVGKDGSEAPNVIIIDDLQFKYEPVTDPQTHFLAFQCNLCKVMIKKRNTIESHMYRHIASRKFTCHICKKDFRSSRDLRKHRKVHIPNREMFQCDVCDKVLSSKGCLKTHKKRHRKEYSIQCTICTAGFYSNHEYTLHMGAKHGQSEFVCDICNKAVYDKHYLIQHKRTHEEGYKDPKVKCEECGKWFITDKLLKIHHKRVHGDNIEKHICDICGKELSSNTSLKNHIIVHQGLKPYQCDLCQRSFANKCTLNVHLRIHTGAKPYTCEVCGKSFSQSSAHKIHLRKHNGENNYLCQICDNSFVTKTCLNMHIKKKHKIVDSFHHIIDNM